jgi:hypothetical protein
MSLIFCPECKARISSLAPNCPSCGCPIATRREAMSAGTQITTTQQTAKRFKSGMMIGAVFVAAGFAMSFNDYPEAGPALIGFGLLIYLVSRFKAWWNNG